MTFAPESLVAGVVLALDGAPAPLAGRLAFAAVFVAVIAWLVWLPRTGLWQDDGSDRPRPWWRSARFWGIAVASIQVLLYLLWR